MEYQSGDNINERYRVVGILGHGGTAITYEVEDLIERVNVAMKVLSLNRIADWKVVDLFEREAKALANLNHPKIPKYINYFYLDVENTRCFFLIQELISGKSLATMVEKGWFFQETNVREIAQQVLSILVYLHGLNPPVIHRDIKPHNIIQNDIGDIYLVDFGAVQDVYRNTLTRGGTFVGTIDYMPPEQLRGQANYSSDLYSLGCTLLYLLIKRSPLELPLNNMKLDFHNRVKISHSFANWLDKAIDPVMEDRFTSTEEALNHLCNYSLFSSTVPVKAKPPSSSMISTKTNNKLTIKTSKIERKHHWVNFGFIIIFMAMSIIVGFLLFSFRSSDDFLGILMFVLLFAFSFSPLFWEYIIVCDYEFSFEVDRTNFVINQKFLLSKHQIKGKTKDISNLKVIYYKDKQGSFKATYCAFWHGVKQIKFARGTTQSEKIWMAAEIINFLVRVNPEYKSAVQNNKLLKIK